MCQSNLASVRMKVHAHFICTSLQLLFFVFVSLFSTQEKGVKTAPLYNQVGDKNNNFNFIF